MDDDLLYTEDPVWEQQPTTGTTSSNARDAPDTLQECFYTASRRIQEYLHHLVLPIGDKLCARDLEKLLLD